MTGPAAPLWGSITLRNWLLEGGRPDRTSPLLSRWRSAAFDISLSLQSALPPPPTLDQPPLFILGLWRSGTTLLHELIGRVPGHAAPRTRQCFRPASFRLSSPPTGSVPVPRPMDDLMVSAESAQEDEFALLLLGCQSLYRGFLDPRRLSALDPLLEGADADTWVPPATAFLRGVLSDSGKRLVVKSPNHLFRARSLLAAFPDSPILITLRDPAETYWSNLRMWTSMCALYGLWEPPSGAIEDFLSRAIAAAADSLVELVERRDRPMAIVSFATLASDPAATAERALARIGLSTPNAAKALKDSAPVLAATPRTPRKTVPDCAAAACRKLADVQAHIGSPV